MLARSPLYLLPTLLPERTTPPGNGAITPGTDITYVPGLGGLAYPTIVVRNGSTTGVCDWNQPAGQPVLAKCTFGTGTGRLTQFRHNDYRIVLGLRGDLGKNWNYDGYLQYGSVQVNNRQSGNFNTNRINQSLNAIAGPNGPICNPAGNPDAGCVPISDPDRRPSSPPSPVASNENLAPGVRSRG